MTRRFKLVGGALALALALVSSVTCFAATVEMPMNSQAACCPEMNQGCGAAATTMLSDCCAAQNPAFAGLAAAAAFAVTPPPSAVSVILLSPEPAVLSLLPVFDREVSIQPDTPTYLLVSVFRL